jgi:hypothetical protein
VEVRGGERNRVGNERVSELKERMEREGGGVGVER